MTVISPTVWGSKMWHALHYVSLGYPENPTEDQKRKYKSFYLLLQDVLPCAVCAGHYAENLKRLPLTDSIMSDREALIKWVIDMHNIVNESKNKPIVPYAIARQTIETNAKCDLSHMEIYEQVNTNTSLLYTMIGLLFALVMIAVIYKKH